MRYLIYPLVGLILAISTSLNAGTIQKWVDDKGNVHYGDAPPVEVKSENVNGDRVVLFFDNFQERFTLKQHSVSL